MWTLLDNRDNGSKSLDLNGWQEFERLEDKLRDATMMKSCALWNKFEHNNDAFSPSYKLSQNWNFTAFVFELFVTNKQFRDSVAVKNFLELK